MRELWIDQNNPDPELVAIAAAVVKDGGLIIFPTDTVYGLGASIFNPAAVERIFTVKGRRFEKGLIVMLADLDQLPSVCAPVPAYAERFMERFWPGPLTLLLPARDSLGARVAVDGKVGVRIPDNRLVRDLIRRAGGPLATTSANISGAPSPVGAGQAREQLGGAVDLIIDGGLCAFGIESTVADVGRKSLTVVREGAVSGRLLQEVEGGG